ncbi:hypothetical protein L6R50_02725 [Myxococcota bacterium]|nr:hypothetical protein [Myxococcota bacterium]
MDGGLGIGGRVLAALLGLAAGCGPGFDTGDPPVDDDGAPGGDDDGTGTGDDDSAPPPLYDHFCGDPVVAGEAQAAWAALMASPSPDDSLAPAPVYPQDETRYPGNWPAPRWSWLAGGGGATAFLVEVEVPNEECPLRVVTTETSWTPDPATWDVLGMVAPGLPATLRVTGAVVDAAGGTLVSGPWTSSAPRTFVVLSFGAPGRIVYWTTSYDGALISVRLGETAPSYLYGPSTNGGRCVGCHVGSPDGRWLATQAWQNCCGAEGYGVDVVDTADLLPMGGMSSAAASLFGTPDAGWPAISPAFWTEADPRLVVYRDGHLKSVGLLSGVITDVAASGDSLYQAEPAWSPDGQSVAYVSTEYAASSLAYGVVCDIWTVPYADGYGGAASPLAGASESGWYETFPQYAPDGRWLAFNRASDAPHGAPTAEVWLVPAAGGAALRLGANDPAPELGQVSPGVQNSIPKWAPGWQDLDTDRWYLLTFSSTREYGVPQVWIAPLVVDAAGGVTSYPALHLPGQDTTSGNHIPVWMQSDS